MNYSVTMFVPSSRILPFGRTPKSKLPKISTTSFMGLVKQDGVVVGVSTNLFLAHEPDYYVVELLSVDLFSNDEPLEKMLPLTFEGTFRIVS